MVILPAGNVRATDDRNPGPYSFLT
jgi:hypothetical protein